MAYNAVTDDVTLSVLRYGFSVFVPGAGETQVALVAAPLTIPIDGILLAYNKVVAGVFTEMTAPEKAAVDAAVTNPAINEQTGTSYTLQDSDDQKYVQPTNASDFDLTVPPGLKCGFVTIVEPQGDGQVTLVEGSGVTIENADGHMKVAKKFAPVTLRWTAPNVYTLYGYTAA